MSSQDKTIEQLWYTWSKTGLDTISAGFRIRAASEGFKDIRSARVQSTNAYLYYSLPRDRDINSALGIAPVCLALINTGQERILLHKVYSGQNDYGRYGMYFIHLLMGLPAEFTAKEAISLWRSDFWQRSDKDSDPSNKSLECLSLQELVQKSKKRPLNSHNSALIQKYLPFLVHAYLSKNLRAEKMRISPPKLYIVASDGDVALLISTLLECLPPQLVSTLTFSTYESRLRESATEIVGRCWYAVPDAERDPDIQKLLPLDDQEELVVNCYTGKESLLSKHPQVSNDPRLERCAQDATNYILSQNQAYQEMLDEMQAFPDLTVSQFLTLYVQHTQAADNPIQEDIERVLSPQADTDYAFSARMLSRRSYQNKLLERVQQEPDWWQHWHEKVIKLHKQSAIYPSLREALLAVAISTSSRIVGSLQNTVKQNEEEIIKEASLFKLLLDLLQCLAPPQEEPDIWRTLLQEIGKIENIDMFFLTSWESYATLMQLSVFVLSPSSKNNEQDKQEKSSTQVRADHKLIEPFLKFLLWPEFGPFLSLQLPQDWIEAVAKRLIFDTKVHLSEGLVRELEQNYASTIEVLFKQWAQDPSRGATAMALFDLLASKEYGKKIDLWLLLLNSPLGKFEENSKRLFQMVHLKSDEAVSFLKRFGPQYLPLELPNEMGQAIMSIFQHMAQGGHHQEKMEVLFYWLAVKPLISWFSTPPEGEQHLTTVLTAANLNVQECGQFFQRYGKTYVSLYVSSPILLDLFEHYARLEEPERITYLEFWLAHKLNQQTLERALNAAHLRNVEKVGFIQRYGTDYLTLYPKSQVLESYVEEFLSWLLTADLNILTGREPSQTEKLLGFLLERSVKDGSIVLSVEPQLLYAWLTVVTFLRVPRLLRQKPERVITSIQRILSEETLSEVTRTQLINAFVLSWMTYERQMPEIMDLLRKKLPDLNVLSLLYTLAESANQGVYQRRHPRTLLISCLQVAESFQEAFSGAKPQKIFMQSFVNTLLAKIDEKTRSWLSMRGWPAELSPEWKEYVSQQASHTLAEPSWEERLLIGWERGAARRKMERAVRNKDSERIFHVCIEYMTILTGEKAHLPTHYGMWLNDAWNSLHLPQGKKHWWDQPSQFPQAGLADDINAAEVAAAQQVMQAGYASKEAFLQMRMALDKGDIGRIVDVATAYDEIFRLSLEKVSDEWRIQVKAAWEFLSAWREVDQQNDYANKSKLLNAGQKIEKLAKKKKGRSPTPLFTAYEIRHLREIRRTLAQQEAQWVLTTPKEEILKVLQTDLVSKN